MKAPYTLFGQTRNVEVKVYVNAQLTGFTTWEKTLWVERGEDWYSFESDELKNKKVRVVQRSEWIRSQVIEETKIV